MLKIVAQSTLSVTTKLFALCSIVHLKQINFRLGINQSANFCRIDQSVLCAPGIAKEKVGKVFEVFNLPNDLNSDDSYLS
jgi:hypothetical protein